MDPIPIGNRIKAARLRKNLTQTELADQCRLHIRTIQRIENGETIPHAYTLRLINDVLETDFVMEPSGSNEKDLPQLRSIFRRRKKIRQISIISVVVFLILVGFVVLPVTRALDIPRLAWAPFVYLIMFGYIIGIALSWRCPGCGALLGDAFNTRFCSKCGLRFYEE